MFRWLWRAALLAFLAYVGHSFFDGYRRGAYNMPELAEDEFFVAFKSGFNGVVSVPGAKKEGFSKVFPRYSHLYPDRKFLALPFDVSDALKTGWSRCLPFDDALLKDWLASVAQMSEDQQIELRGARWDLFCALDIDGEFVPRGVVYSFPRL